MDRHHLAMAPVYHAQVYYALFHDYVPGILERRGPFRPGHLDLVRAHHERGELLMAGAWGEPVDGALFIFKADGPETIEAFVESDPYVKNGLVVAHRIRQWNVVTGGAEQ